MVVGCCCRWCSLFSQQCKCKEEDKDGQWVRLVKAVFFLN